MNINIFRQVLLKAKGKKISSRLNKIQAIIMEYGLYEQNIIKKKLWYFSNMGSGYETLH